MVVTDCPYCNEPMVSGKILGDRYALKWMDEDQKLIMGIFAPIDSIILSEPTFGRPVVKGYICKKCRKIVIDY